MRRLFPHVMQEQSRLPPQSNSLEIILSLTQIFQFLGRRIMPKTEPMYLFYPHK